ncbi:MAG: hypothetical protein JRJ51_05385 [Deltaproteobacteria bacterium]|nr:hypothetical protein [Deltaproteobacteria bacterium]
MGLGNKERCLCAPGLLLIFVVLFCGLNYPASGEAKNDVCNSKVRGYLKSIGFSPGDVSRICTEARIYKEEYQEESNRCEALARQIELLWEERYPSKPLDIRVIKHAVDLVCPRVCTDQIAKYLKSVGISIQSVREICILAETLVERKAFSKEKALHRAMLEKSTTIFEINGQVIKEAVMLLKKNSK